MIDLRKEIEKLKNRGGWTNDKFYHTAINDVEVTLNRYNIITAPKTIKLSEILDRLNKEHKKTINGNIIFEYKINRNGWYNTDGTSYHLTDTTIDSYYYGKKLLTVIKFNKKMAMTVLDFGDNFKWLYALWITGTIIEDDLQEK